MNNKELSEKVWGYLKSSTRLAKKFEDLVAVSITLISENTEEMFVAVRDGQLMVEPYRYNDNNCSIEASAETIDKVFSGELSFDKALTEGYVKVKSGDPAKFKALEVLVKKKTAEKTTKTAAKKTETKTETKPAAKTAAKAETKKAETKAAPAKAVETPKAEEKKPEVKPAPAKVAEAPKAEEKKPEVKAATPAKAPEAPKAEVKKPAAKTTKSNVNTSNKKKRRR